MDSKEDSDPADDLRPEYDFRTLRVRRLGPGRTRFGDAERVVIEDGLTALIQRDGRWWIGWIEQDQGVNSHGSTRDELLENLRSALRDAEAFRAQEETIRDVS